MKFSFSINQKLLISFKKERALIVTSLLVLILLLMVLFFSERIVYVLYQPFVKSTVSRTEKSLNQNLEYLSEQTKQIASSGNLNYYIEKKDSLNLSSILDNERKNRNIGIMLVTDKEGVVLSRRGEPSLQGDYIFLTTSWGNALLNGKDVKSFEKGMFPSSIMIAGDFINKNGEVIGSLFSGYSIDNEYTVKFKEQYLSKGTNLAFYTKEEGVTGTSFKNKETVKLVNTYFNIGSELISKNLPDLKKEIQIEGKYYFVKNIIFSGIEESPGGVFVFYPSPHQYQSLGLAIIILLIFLLVEPRIHHSLFDHSVKRKKHIIILFIGSLIIFLTSVYVTLYKLDKNTIELKEPVYTIFNSIIKFEPESDVSNRLSEKRIAIKVFTGGEAINTAEAVVNYDPQMAEVLDIITTNSFCEQDLFIMKAIDNENGVVDIACVLPSPGFSEPNGIVAELLIQPLKGGQLSLHFGDETKVLANDGLGTNVLRLAIDGSYNIVSYDDQQNIKEPLTVFSYTHPNSERWCKRKNVQFSWFDIKGAKYRYALNNIPDFIPSEENITSENSLSFDVDKDGIYYFHLLPEVNGNVGTVAHFKVMIDFTPPLLPIVKTSQTNINVGEIVRFAFVGQDELSGIQAGYYVKIDEGILLPVAQPLYIPFLSSGKHFVTIRVFDKAGNFSDTEVEIKVGMKQ